MADERVVKVCQAGLALLEARLKTMLIVWYLAL
jgi:hypothetical protein